MTSRPIPQTSVGRLVNLSADNPMYYTAPSSASSALPHLIPISTAAMKMNNNVDDELTMIWRNMATLFAKYDNVDTDIERQANTNKRCIDEVYQELQALRTEIEEYQKKAEEESHIASSSSSSSSSGSAATLVRKLKKYVNKKCEKMRETASYGAYNADNEVFDYVNTTRSDLDAKNKKMEGDLANLY